MERERKQAAMEVRQKEKAEAEAIALSEKIRQMEEKAEYQAEVKRVQEAKDAALIAEREEIGRQKEEQRKLTEAEKEWQSVLRKEVR